MNRCPIAPGKGCAACDELDSAVRAAVRANHWHRVRILAVIAAALLALALLPVVLS